MDGRTQKSVSIITDPVIENDMNPFHPPVLSVLLNRINTVYKITDTFHSSICHIMK